MMNLPERITVHLGPCQEQAENITVSFYDYLNNVASSENSPVWPQNAIQANICIAAAFAIRRMQSRCYRDQGYNFDITNDVRTDPCFTFGRPLFEHVTGLLDQLFPDVFEDIYQNTAENRYAAGSLPWECVLLAEQGLDTRKIITAVLGAPAQNVRTAQNNFLPNFTEPLKRGSAGPGVRQLQNWINRVSSHYGSIPKIQPTDGVYGAGTEKSVSMFQKAFGLKSDGKAERITWYKIFMVYSSVRRFSKIGRKNRTLPSGGMQLSSPLKPGDSGTPVSVLHQLLRFLSLFEPAVSVAPEGELYDEHTQAAVRSFQLCYGLEATGTVDWETWELLFKLYRAACNAVPDALWGRPPAAYPGYSLLLGMRGPIIQSLQECLLALRETNPALPPLHASGTFGAQTRGVVAAFQKNAGILPNGIVDRETWDAILFAYEDLQAGKQLQFGQYPGYILKEGEQDGSCATTANT